MIINITDKKCLVKITVRQTDGKLSEIGICFIGPVLFILT